MRNRIAKIGHAKKAVKGTKPVPPTPDRRKRKKNNTDKILNKKKAIITPKPKPKGKVKPSAQHKVNSRIRVNNHVPKKKVIPHSASEVIYPNNLKINHDVDVVVCVLSYNRFNKLNRLLAQLYDQPTKRKFAVILMDDSSTQEGYSKLTINYPDLIHLKNRVNNGKEYFWASINACWDIASKHNAEYLLQLDDDFVLCDNFIDRLLDLFDAKSKKNSKVIGLKYHKCIFNGKRLDWTSTDKVDGGTCFKSSFLKKINFRVKPVPLAHFRMKKTPTSNVWTQIGNQVANHKCHVIQTKQSYVWHDGNDDSTMYGKFRSNFRLETTNFIDSKPKLNYMKKTENVLLIGPWVGEFGWELFCWQGYVRKQAKNFNRVIVMGRPNHKFLYQDFCDTYVEFDPESYKTDAWNCHGAKSPVKVIEQIPHTKYISGRFDIGFRLTKARGLITAGRLDDQIFHKYESDITVDQKYDVIFHCRNKSTGDMRNWNINKWRELKNLLPPNLKVACIGNNQAFHIEGTDDLRNISLEELCATFQNSKIIVGPSSGPMHYASLCGLKHLVWSDDFNEIRYRKLWNPFNTEVVFEGGGWDPEPNRIKDLILENI